MTDKQHMQELASYRFTVENLRARVAELEAQLAAAPQAGQPVAWLTEYVDREGNSKWYVSTHKDLATENDKDAKPKPLYTHPTTQGLEHDAARYRWLRATTNTVTNSDGKRIDVRNQPEVWDKAIDAALAAQAKQGGAANG